MVFINDIEMLDIYLDKYLGKIVYKLKCQKDKKWLNYTYENWFK
jgi:hypothetical protein